MVVDNSEKIQKLYGRALEAERATAEVEKQLTVVESQQDELSNWLDSYESKVDEMMSRQMGGDGLQGPDQERERTYVSCDPDREIISLSAIGTRWPRSCLNVWMIWAGI